MRGGSSLNACVWMVDMVWVLPPPAARCVALVDLSISVCYLPTYMAWCPGRVVAAEGEHDLFPSHSFLSGFLAVTAGL